MNEIPSNGAVARVSLAGRTQDADYSVATSFRPHIARSVVFLALVLIFTALWAIGLTFSTLAVLGTIGVRTVDFGPQIDSALSLVGIAGMIIFGFSWMVSLFVAVREFVAEDNVLVKDAAGHADSVRAAIGAAVEKRCPPFTASADELGGSSTIYITNDYEWALIVVREIGPDLQIGWTMWRSRSTITLIGRVLSEMFSGARANDLQLLRAATCSALREMLQNEVCTVRMP